MSGDWAMKYIDTHKQRQQEQKNRQRRADLAATGAPSVFQKITDRIRLDIQTFHNAGALLDLKVIEETPEGEFRVVWSVNSWVAALDLKLNIVLIQYEQALGKEARSLDFKRGTLRICSDLDGIMKVYRNGDKNGNAFVDETEISEFLLQPLLDHIDG